MAAVFKIIPLLYLTLSASFRFSIDRVERRSATLFAGKGSISTTDKVRVRLLKNVEGQGRQGETVLVSRSYWLNFLQPKKMAVTITEEQILKEQREAEATAAAELANANACADYVNKMKIVSIRRKMGSSGQLFGAVTSKQLLEIVKADLPGSLNPSSKYFSVNEVLLCLPKKDNPEGFEACESIEGNEIKRAGRYKIVVKFLPSVLASFMINIEKES